MPGDENHTIRTSSCRRARNRDVRKRSLIEDVSSHRPRRRSEREHDAVQKGKERWEIARDSGSKADSEVKVGDKVTVTYRITATKIEGKGAASAETTDSEGRSAEKK